MRNIIGAEAITFLRQLLSHLRGPLVLLGMVERVIGVGTRAKRELSNIDHDLLVTLTLQVVRSLQRIGRSQVRRCAETQAGATGDIQISLKG